MNRTKHPATAGPWIVDDVNGKWGPQYQISQLWEDEEGRLKALKANGVRR